MGAMHTGQFSETLAADAPLERFLGAPPVKRATFRPVRAWRHMQNLLADKENTEEVFHIIRALNGNAFERAFQAFIRSEDGQARMRQARVLPPLLDDHARWAGLPEGSFGRAYVNFMQAEGLTAAGLVAESLKPAGSREWRESIDPLRRWYADRARDTHDMYHVLTGLGRDALGETCVLAFTFPQHGKGWGLKFISWLGTLEARKTMRALGVKRAPALRAIRECERIGRKAKMIDAQDLIALFPLPLDEVRAQLNISPPTAYHVCHARCREAGVDPYDLVT